MNNSLKKIYEHHHTHNREEGFSVMEEERGALFKEIIGGDKKVLDIGCRDGALTKYFVANNSVLGVDIDENALKRVERELRISTLLVDLNGDWHELEGNKFDAIVAGEVLEHLYYPEQVTQRVVKHLRKSGVFVGSVPNAFSFKNRYRYVMGRKKHTPLDDPTHINHFRYDELRGLLRDYFSDVNIIGIGRYKRLSRLYPKGFAFDLVFVARNPH